MSSKCLFIGFVNVSWRRLRQVAATQAPGTSPLSAKSQRPPLGTFGPVGGAALPTAGIAMPAARVKRWSNLSARASLPAARAVSIAVSRSSQYVSISRVSSQCAVITRSCNHELSDWRSRRSTWFFSEEHCQSACHRRNGVGNLLEFSVRHIKPRQRQKRG